MTQPHSITLDPGHGGKDSGAVGPSGLREKDVVLNVTTRLALMLRAAGIAVKETRMDDRFLELRERADIANKAGTDLFLSVHCNSGEPGKGEGFEVFTTPGNTGSDRFATKLFLEYAKAFPGKRKRVDTADGDVDKEANFAVLRQSDMPAALFELEFIHTAAGEAFLRDPANQERMAEALCDGVLACFGMTGPGPGAEASERMAVAAARVLPAVKSELRRLATELNNLADRA